MLLKIVQELNSLLRNKKEELKGQQPFFVFITGASGAGKSFLTHALEKELDLTNVHIAYFDRIGVPTAEAMIDIYGSGEKWQEATTYLWIQQLLALKHHKMVIILEGQYNPQFVLDACKKFNVLRYVLIGVHAERSIRERRLVVQRGQPELVNEDMNNWAEFLKRKTREVGGDIVDTSASDTQQNMIEIVSIIKNKISLL